MASISCTRGGIPATGPVKTNLEMQDRCEKPAGKPAMKGGFSNDRSFCVRVIGFCYRQFCQHVKTSTSMACQFQVICCYGYDWGCPQNSTGKIDALSGATMFVLQSVELLIGSSFDTYGL